MRPLIACALLAFVLRPLAWFSFHLGRLGAFHRAFAEEEMELVFRNCSGESESTVLPLSRRILRWAVEAGQLGTLSRCRKHGEGRR